MKKMGKHNSSRRRLSKGNVKSANDVVNENNNQRVKSGKLEEEKHQLRKDEDLLEDSSDDCDGEYKPVKGIKLNFKMKVRSN